MAPAPTLPDVIQLVESEAPATDPIVRLQTASAVVHDLSEVGDAALGYFVDQARHAGHSWSEIGDALGVSKQAAQQRHTGRLLVGIRPPTFERFTPRARSVLAAAEPIARDLGHEQIGTSHLLLALYHEPDGVAAQVLAAADAGLEKVEAAVASRTERGPGSPEGKLSFTPRAVAVFSGALASALELGHNYIGTEHLLLGLARSEGVAREILNDFKLTHDVLAEQVADRLQRLVARKQPRRARKQA
jgi:hypothetical protein